MDDDAPVTPDSQLHGLPQVPDEFRQNVGKTGEVFGPEHPYFQVPRAVARKLDARATAKGAAPAPAIPPRFDEAALAKLRALGITVKGGATDAAIIENAQTMPGANLPQLAEDLQAAAKKYRFKWSDPRWMIRNGQGDGTVLYLDYMADTRNETLLMQRRLYVEKGKLYADHDLLELPEALQGGGLSQAVNKAAYKQYQAMGVQAIRVHAALDAGGYVWARVGFEATRLMELKQILADARAAAKVPAPVLDYFQRQLTDHLASTPKAPFPIWQWARTEHGKDLLLGTSWHGQLDLKNEQQTAIFEDYLNRPPRPKKPKK